MLVFSPAVNHRVAAGRATARSIAGTPASTSVASSSAVQLFADERPRPVRRGSTPGKPREALPTTRRLQSR